MGMSKENKQRVLDELTARNPERAKWNKKCNVEDWARKLNIDLGSYNTKCIYGKRLRKQRREKKYTLKDVARVLRVSPQAIQKIEKPKKTKTKTKIDLQQLEIFAILFDTTPTSFLTGARPGLDPINPKARACANIIMYNLYIRAECTDVDLHLLRLILAICATRKQDIREYEKVRNHLYSAKNIREICRIKWRALERGISLKENKDYLGFEDEANNYFDSQEERKRNEECDNLVYRYQWLKKTWEILNWPDDTSCAFWLEKGTTRELEDFQKLEEKTMRILTCAAVADQTNKAELCKHLQEKLDFIFNLSE